MKKGLRLRHYFFSDEAGEKAQEGFGLIHKALGGPKYREIRKARLDGRFYAHPATLDSACIGAEFEEIEVSTLLKNGRLYMADAKAAQSIVEAMERMEDARIGREICDPAAWRKIVENRRQIWGKALREARQNYAASWVEITFEEQIPEVKSWIVESWETPAEIKQNLIPEFIFAEGK